MKIKKYLPAILYVVIVGIITLNLTLPALATTDESDKSEITVFVTITNGELLVAHIPFTVNDVDSDGAVTINDALIVAHEQYYSGIETEDSYAYANGDYGLYITKLWNIDASTSCGYYVNDNMAMSLSDKISDGDEIYAFLYTDTVGFSDMYTYFDTSVKNIKAGDTVTLTLNSLGYDENWSLVSHPAAGAVITIDGVETEYVTDESGSVTIKFENAGTVVLSAKSSTSVITPPVCVIDAISPAPQTGNSIYIYGIICAALLVFIAVKRHEYKIIN